MLRTGEKMCTKQNVPEGTPWKNVSSCATTHGGDSAAERHHEMGTR